jgi:hypothetical protein
LEKRPQKGLLDDQQDFLWDWNQLKKVSLMVLLKG